MDVRLFDFELPEERIALRPAIPRDSARMLVVWPGGRLEHRQIGILPEYLRAGDALLVNDTKVIPARLCGHRLREFRPGRNRDLSASPSIREPLFRAGAAGAQAGGRRHAGIR